MQQPLPPGWEAKFDQGSRRYYFINHSTKQTTWIDPRGAVQQQQYAYRQQQQPSYQQQQRTAYPQQQYQPQQPAAARVPSPVTQRSISIESESESESASSNEDIPLQVRSATPEPSVTEEGETGFGIDNSDLVSDAEKRQLTNKVKAALDLEGVSDDLILMTLDGVMYNESMTIQVFESMGFRKKGARVEESSSADRWETTTTKPKKKTKTTASSASTSAHTSSQPIPSLPSISSQPIPSLEPSKITSGTEISFADLNSKFQGDGGSSLFKNMSADKGSEILSKMRSAADSSVQKMFARPAAGPSVGAMSSSSANTSSTTTSTSVSTYKFAQRMKSNGPNRNLHHGADGSLLRNDRIVSKGSDRKLAVGAQKKLSKGSSKLACGAGGGARGADKSLCVGRNVSLAKGPQRVS